MTTSADTVIKAHKICDGADGNCNECPYNIMHNCTEKLAKDTYKLLIQYRNENSRLKASQVKREPNELVDMMITQLQKQKEIYASKKRKFKNGTSCFQYWLGKEEATKQHIYFLKEMVGDVHENKSV